MRVAVSLLIIQLHNFNKIQWLDASIHWTNTTVQEYRCNSKHYYMEQCNPKQNYSAILKRILSIHGI